MARRDFFGFCTSLTRVELRAIGSLSEVQHFGDGDTIYRPGDAGDAIFIVNRGVVELSQDASRGSRCLSRGGIFGEAEALAGSRRKHRARVFEQTSLQCFPRNNFAALAERVPTFFQFLCEELAFRILEAPEETPPELHLSGSFANFDLVTIYQTIVNSNQTGELSISTEDGEMICTFFFEDGHPRCGQFQHLVGEEAFWQLFLAEELRGSFSFASGPGSVTPSIQSGRITRSPNDMLITALQFRDEFHALKAEMPDAASRLVRTRVDLALEKIQPAALRPFAEEMWQLRRKRELQLGDLYRHFAVCELTIYQALRALIETNQLALELPEASQKVA